MASDEREDMRLSKMERLMLSNQLKILEKLYPEEADSYATQRTAVENGYSLHYPWLMEHLYEEMSVEDCREVLDILEMHRALTYSFDALDEKSGIDQNSIRFRGFDGNNESDKMAYARYYILDLERYEELRSGADFPDFNSHCPTIDRYRRMLIIWRKYPNQFNLSVEKIKSILEA